MKALLALTVLLITACHTSLEINNTELGDSFEVTTINGLDDIPSGISINFNSSEYRIFGSTGCNNYFGTYTKNDNQLSMGPLGVTKKLCFDDERMNAENRLLQLLESVRSYTTVNDELHLKDGNEKVVIKAKPYTYVPAEDFIVEYEITSMIERKTIVYNDQEMVCQLEDTKHIKKLSALESKEIEEGFNELVLEKIDSHQAPSNKRHVDGAAYAKLRIIHDGKTYESQDFDHGNPPSALARMVALITKHNACDD